MVSGFEIIKQQKQRKDNSIQENNRYSSKKQERHAKTHNRERLTIEDMLEADKNFHEKITV